jgi:hypothetical protein
MRDCDQGNNEYLCRPLNNDFIDCAIKFLRTMRPSRQQSRALLTAVPYSQRLQKAYAEWRVNFNNIAVVGGPSADDGDDVALREVRTVRLIILELANAATAGSSVVTPSLCYNTSRSNALQFVKATRKQLQSPSSSRVSLNHDPAEVVGTELIHATRMNNVSEVKRLIREGANVNYMDSVSVS